MAHLSDNPKKLRVRRTAIGAISGLSARTEGFGDLCVLTLPQVSGPVEPNRPLQKLDPMITTLGENLGEEATLVLIGESVDLVAVLSSLPASLHYRCWIAVKRTEPRAPRKDALRNHHFGVLVLTRYKGSLRHTRTRVEYTYCPACDKTTKDYGGKKHTYHEYGTSISDVWRDISADPQKADSPVIDRLLDLFGIKEYSQALLLDARKLPSRRAPKPSEESSAKAIELTASRTNKIFLGDCLKELKRIPTNSIDFAFTDPPYNLRKGYTGYSDDLEISEYFKWCGEWIAELHRVLKPGRTCALLNIPFWAVRHFSFMQSMMTYQNWIAWDALSFPVRLIMPAHYSILCFTKGQSRALPGLDENQGAISIQGAPRTFRALQPLAEDYCLRSSCVERRRLLRTNDRGPLTDLWWDIHRLKHNSRRVDHPTQLPPHLMYRLISMFTNPGETVLDCFDGAGTTTLAAHQLERRYIGIEKSKKYVDMATKRHKEIEVGVDPFRKEERKLTAKNSPVPRLLKQKYIVPKKTLQLEVKRVAHKLGRLPNRDEVIRYAKYPIEFYDKYFASWGEVCAAARTTGMSEVRNGNSKKPAPESAQLAFKY